MQRFAALALVVGALIMLGACPNPFSSSDSDSDSGSDSSPSYAEINLNTDYTGQSIASGGFRYYTFAAGSSAQHTIRVTNLSSDIVWHLFETRAAADNGGSIDAIKSGNSASSTGDEVLTATLRPGTTYWLVVCEEDEAGSSSFDLRVDNFAGFI